LSLASDIYSLGVLLYELVTGVNPQYREGDTFQQVRVKCFQAAVKVWATGRGVCVYLTQSETGVATAL
jgi:serine/threonine protein kinase